MLIQYFDKLKQYDLITYNHCMRVGSLCKVVGEKLGITDENIIRLYIAGVCHDIGKLLIPQSILNKEGKLSEEEWKIMKKHPIYSCQIVEPYILDPTIKQLILYHHEKIDGTGYYSIKNLSIFSQIIHYTDIFDALYSDRPYKCRYNKERTLEILSEEQCPEQILDILMKINTLNN